MKCPDCGTELMNTYNRNIKHCPKCIRHWDILKINDKE